MRAIITTTSGQITWESSGTDVDEMTKLVERWTRWVAGRNPHQFAHLGHDSGAVTIWYRDIVRIEIEGER